SCVACGALTHLHSFPTRRSSDLLMLGLLLVVAIFSGNLAPLREVSAAPPESFARRTCRTLLRAVIDPVILVSKGIDPILSGNDLDRKSTRLNSSHVKISYAVFCL